MGAVDDGVLAGGGNHLKFFAQITTNGAAVCGHRPVTQAEAVKDAAVGVGHHLVAGLGRGLVAVETVGVLHDEFAAAHQAKARAAFVAEFGLDLVQVLGQLFVAAKFLARDVGHDFLAGRLDHVVALVAVAYAQQLRPHLAEASGLLPQLGRLHHRHRQLNGTGTVHFFAHDGLHLANHAQTHGHVGEDADPELLDQAGAHHQLVADDFGIGGRIAQRRDKELGSFHEIGR